MNALKWFHCTNSKAVFENQDLLWRAFAPARLASAKLLRVLSGLAPQYTANAVITEKTIFQHAF